MIKKSCKYCGNDFFVKDSHKDRAFYCSKKCMAEDYKARLKKSANPNWKGGISFKKERIEAPKKKCVSCDNPVSRNGEKYCSRACFYKTRYKGWSPEGKKCKVCGKKLSKRKLVYCSPDCRKTYSKKEFKIKKKCPICGQDFLTYKSRIHKYCSRSCYSKELSLRQLGEKSHLWKGGKTDNKRHIREHILYKEWRMKVFTRDNFTCQDCKISSSKKPFRSLTSHHIIPFSVNPKLAFKVSNGITLCWDCHKERHKRNGYKKAG